MAMMCQFSFPLKMQTNALKLTVTEEFPSLPVKYCMMWDKSLNPKMKIETLKLFRVKSGNFGNRKFRQKTENFGRCENLGFDAGRSF